MMCGLLGFLQLGLVITGFVSVVTGQYRLMGAGERTLYGWGARVAGLMLALGIPGAIFLVLLGSQNMPEEQFARMAIWADLASVVFVGGVSYVFAELAYALQPTDVDQPSHGGGLSGRQQARLERKREKRRLEYEENRRWAEEQAEKAARRQRRREAEAAAREAEEAKEKQAVQLRAQSRVYREESDEERAERLRRRRDAEDEDRPRRRRQRDEDDEGDYDDDRPAGIGTGWMIAASVGGLLVLGGMLTGIVLLLNNDRPTQVVQQPPVPPPFQPPPPQPPPPKFNPPRFDPPPPKVNPPPRVETPRDPFPGLKVAQAKLDVRDAIPSLLWHNDADSFFLADKSGAVRRIKHSTFQELRVHTLRDVSWLALSSQGLLASTQSGVVVLDPDTLVVRREIPLPIEVRAVSAPNLHIAFASAPQERSLWVLDLKAGTILNKFTEKQIPSGVGFHNPTMSPDGQYLFTQGSGAIHRFVVRGGVFFEESTPDIAAGRGGQIQVSAGSRFLCLPTGGGNKTPPGLPGLPSYSTNIFTFAELRRPAVAIHSGAYPEVVAFDAKTGNIFAQNADHHLIVFNSRGEKQREYRFAPGNVSTRQLLVHPGGGRLLVLSHHLYDVTVQ